MALKHWIAVLALAGSLAGCDSGPLDVTEPPPVAGCPQPTGKSVLGLGCVPGRYTSEVFVRGQWAYTGTWGSAPRGGRRGDVLKIWNVAGSVPILHDSVLVPGVVNLGDVQVSDDGRILVVATEGGVEGSLLIFDLADPAEPRRIATFASTATRAGVHTVKLGRVDGRLYAFLSVNPSPPQLVVVDLSEPASPQQVAVRQMGVPFIHDVFVRDGVLFTALWNAGMTIWDIGGAGRGGSPADPRLVGNVLTVGGSVHNIWWFHDPTTGAKRYAFVGEEGPGTTGSTASGDLHVVDVSDLANPVEVAVYRVPGAGAHNFWMDEQSGILYAAFYNGGVRALDVRGDLGTCTSEQRVAGGRCDLARMGREVDTFLLDVGRPVYVWGVQWIGTHLYAADMLNGLWKLNISHLRRP
jgi:hypothetical protein